MDENVYTTYELRFSYDTPTGERAVEYRRTVVSENEKLSEAIGYYLTEIKKKSIDDNVVVTARKEGGRENVNYH